MIQREGGLTTLPDSTPHVEITGSDDVTNPHDQVTTRSEESSTMTAPEPRRSGRERHAPNFYKPSSSSCIYRHSTRYEQQLIASGNSEWTYWNDIDAFTLDDHRDWYTFSTGPTARLIDEPRTYAQAMKSPYKDQWQAACD